MVATDVVSRGIDIDDIELVINFDAPTQAEDYVHRIGRTARAGASGEAHSFACEDTAFYLPEIEAYTGKTIPVVRLTAELLAQDLQKAKAEARQPIPQGRRRHNNQKPGGHSQRRKPSHPPKSS